MLCATLLPPSSALSHQTFPARIAPLQEALMQSEIRNICVCILLKYIHLLSELAVLPCPRESHPPAPTDWWRQPLSGRQTVYEIGTEGSEVRRCWVLCARRHAWLQEEFLLAQPHTIFFFLHCRTSARHGRSTAGISWDWNQISPEEKPNQKQQTTKNKTKQNKQHPHPNPAPGQVDLPGKFAN